MVWPMKESDANPALEQLHKVLAELEKLAASVSESAGGASADRLERLQDALGAARERIRDTEQSIRRSVSESAKAADGFVHENTWLSIAIAAAVAFLLGALTAKRE
jgi:ElaB/YqjD/DUF883 family membrane-anchored ribosome-binding protein